MFRILNVPIYIASTELNYFSDSVRSSNELKEYQEYLHFIYHMNGI